MFDMASTLRFSTTPPLEASGTTCNCNDGRLFLTTENILGKEAMEWKKEVAK
jgi:hypothetical protein